MGPTAYIYEDFLITLSESCQNWISIPCFPFKLQLSITFCLKMSSAARDSVKKDFKISIKQLKWLNDFRFCPFKSVISDINHTRRQGQEILLSNYISLPFEITLPWQSNQANENLPAILHSREENLTELVDTYSAMLSSIDRLL